MPSSKNTVDGCSTRVSLASSHFVFTIGFGWTNCDTLAIWSEIFLWIHRRWRGVLSSNFCSAPGTLWMYSYYRRPSVLFVIVSAGGTSCRECSCAIILPLKKKRTDERDFWREAVVSYLEMKAVRFWFKVAWSITLDRSFQSDSWGRTRPRYMVWCREPPPSSDWLYRWLNFFCDFNYGFWTAPAVQISKNKEMF